MADYMPLVIIGGIVAIGFLFKDQILEAINAGGEEPIEEEPPAAAPTTPPAGGEAEDDLGDEPGDNPEMSKKTVAIDYYAGKIANSVATSADDNVYAKEKIKEVVIDKFVDDVESLAESSGYKVGNITEANPAAFRLYCKLVLKVSSNMRIRLKSREKRALEAVAGVSFGGFPRDRPTIVIVSGIIHVPVPVIVSPVPPRKLYRKVVAIERRKRGKWYKAKPRRKLVKVQITPPTPATPTTPSTAAMGTAWPTSYFGDMIYPRSSVAEVVIPCYYKYD